MSGTVWEVIGGKTSAGLLVRTGKDTKSPERPGGRLSTGALVAELELDGERLRYTLLVGKGPEDGWVSLKLKGTQLLIRAGEAGSKAAAEAKEVEEAKKNYGTEGARRIWMMPQGTRGDVQPFVALGIGLRKAGIEVRFLAPACFKGFVESYGFAFTEQGIDCKAKMDEKEDDDDPETWERYKEDPHKWGEDKLDRWYNDEEFVASGAKVLHDLLEIERPDLILAHALNGVIPFLAWKKCGIPIYGVEFQPSMGTPPEEMEDKFRTFQGRASKMVEAATGINPADGAETSEYVRWRMTQNYCACHDAVVDPLVENLEWATAEDKAAIKAKFKPLCTGFLVLDPALQMIDAREFGGAAGLKRIQEYLDAGPKPVYVGWGSMPVPTFTLARVVLCLKMNRKRAIVCAGWGSHTLQALREFLAENVPEDQMGIGEYAAKELLFVDVAPHEWLFQRCACTLHHGGAGTTCAALRAGVPTIITPMIVDQFFYAAWVEHLGCGLSLDLREQPDKLLIPAWSKALRKATGDEEMLRVAKLVQAELRKQDAVQDMVSLLETALADARRRGPAEKRPLGS